MKLKNKVVIVTGGAGGCGLAASKLFSREGAKVGILDLPNGKGEEAEKEINDSGGSALFAAADVSDAKQVSDAIDKITDKFGNINGLFNHAGILSAQPFLETGEAEWEKIMNVNVKSMFLVTKKVIPYMLESGGGSIVCTSSISGVVATPFEVLYCTSKGACHMFSRAIAVEFRDRGIRCNSVCPGFIDTAHGRREVAALTKHGLDVSENAIKESQGRMCKPEEVAATALFLLSDDASFISGSHVFVDNGFCAQ